MAANDTSRHALAIAVATCTPVLLWGPPGTGKTATVRAVARGLGLDCEVVVASIHDPTDFSGLPVVTGGEVRLPAARGMVAAFVSARPRLACVVPAGAEAGRAWPSPRSWKALCRLWAAADAAGATPDVRAALVAGTVGAGAAVEFLTWQAKVDLPDPEAILAAPSRYRLPRRPDRLFAVLCAVAAAVAGDPTRERWEAGSEIVGRAAEIGPDAAAVAGRVLAGCRPPGALPAACLAGLAPVLRDAGLLGAA